jgi:hypothetical protein
MQQNNVSAAPEKKEIPELPQPEVPQGKVFEYTGTGSLSITGAYTGYTYYFPFTGAQVNVDYHDVFALVAEPGLTLVPRSTQAS